MILVQSSIEWILNQKKKKKSSIEFKLSTIYPRVIWTKFKLPTCGLKFDILT